MQIQADKRGNILYIRLQGEMDEHSASFTRREADRLADNFRGGERAVFDLEKVAFMDSSGIGFLLGRFKLCNRFGVAVYIKSPNAAADKILEMSGVYALIPKLGGERRTV